MYMSLKIPCFIPLYVRAYLRPCVTPVFFQPPKVCTMMKIKKKCRLQKLKNNRQDPLEKVLSLEGSRYRITICNQVL